MNAAERQRLLSSALRSSSITSKLEVRFSQELGLLGVKNVESEYRFHPTRKWRFDFACPDVMLAAEINGGIFKKGRHSRGAGQTADYEKINAAIELGWRVFQFGPTQIRSGQAALQFERTLRQLRRLRRDAACDSLPAVSESA